MPNKTRTESKSKARTEANIKPQEFLWREGTLIGFIMKDNQLQHGYDSISHEQFFIFFALSF
jgi:hypothetical protein